MSDLTRRAAGETAVAPERRSKWMDGVLASVLFLLMIVALIVTTILAKRAGTAVLLLETVVMTAVSFVCLRLSMQAARAAVQQAWLGILGGFFAWTAVEAGALLGQIRLETEQGVLPFLIAALFFGMVARRGLPLGAQFWAGAFLANWIGHLILFVQRYLGLNGYPIFETTYRITGVLAGAGVVAVYVWIFRRSQSRIQRLWAALSVFVLVIIVVYAARGFW